MLKFFNKFNRFFSIVGVISSIFLIILVGLIGLFFLLKKISVSKSDQYIVVTKNLIHKSSLNFDQLNPEDSIKIYFHKDMVDDSQIGIIESEPLLSLSPRVDGELFWINKQTLNFKPKKSLSNKKYDVKIDIHRLLDFATHIKSKKDFPKKLSIPLTVIQQGVDQFKYGWENTGSKQGDVKLDADLVFNLPIDLSLLRDGMKVIKSKQTIDFKLEKVDDKGHRFKLVSDTITRTNKKEEFTITIDIPKHDFNHSLKAYTDPMKGFHPTRIHTVNENLKSYIKIDFSDPIKKNQDVRGLIEINNLTSKEKLTFNIVNNSVIVNGPFEPGKNYDVIIFSGIENAFEQKTTAKKMFSISFQHRDPSLRFLHDGMILP